MHGRVASMTTNTDPRPHYRTALTWVRTLADGVPADRLADPTPCAEWDVRGMLGHLVATVDRVRVIGEGMRPQRALRHRVPRFDAPGGVSEPSETTPRVVEGIADDGWTDALAAAEDKMAAVWADDAVLDELVTVPWGRVPGRAAVWGYIREALVHGWDLAVATGQSPEADPATAEAALAETKRVMPAEPRGGPIPFAAPVAPRPGAGPTEQLANWCGHARV
jgi:uncharacterized protein (TIGR03086 family)